MCPSACPIHIRQLIWRRLPIQPRTVCCICWRSTMRPRIVILWDDTRASVSIVLLAINSNIAPYHRSMPSSSVMCTAAAPGRMSSRFRRSWRSGQRGSSLIACLYIWKSKRNQSKLNQTTLVNFYVRKLNQIVHVLFVVSVINEIKYFIAIKERIDND